MRRNWSACGAVFLAAQHVLHRDRVRFGGIAADEEHRLAVVHVIVGIGHRAVAPGIRYAGDRRRMADSRLVIDVVRAPQRREFPEQVGLLVAELGRAKPVHRIRAGALADVEALVADLVDRLFPGNARPLAALEFHRVLEAPFAMSVLAYRRAFGAMSAHVERRVEVRFLADPDAVLHFGDDAAAHRAVRANGFVDFRVDAGCDGRRGVCAPDHPGRQGGCHGGTAEAQAGTAQESAAIHRGPEYAVCCTCRLGGSEVSFLDQLHR